MKILVLVSSLRIHSMILVVVIDKEKNTNIPSILSISSYFFNPNTNAERRTPNGKRQTGHITFMHNRTCVGLGSRYSSEKEEVKRRRERDIKRKIPRIFIILVGTSYERSTTLMNKHITYTHTHTFGRRKRKNTV